MLTHYKLKGYQQALAQAACAEVLSACWGRRHAIVEHYRRACESIVLNIAEGAKLRAGTDKAGRLDYAIGSTLECAGCLVDKSATSVVLNVAEGNGRYSQLDHRRFLEIAASSAVKKAAYLELYQQKATPTCIGTVPGRLLLGRIVAMLIKV